MVGIVAAMAMWISHRGILGVLIQILVNGIKNLWTVAAELILPMFEMVAIMPRAQCCDQLWDTSAGFFFFGLGFTACLPLTGLGDLLMALLCLPCRFGTHFGGSAGVCGRLASR